MTATQPMPPLHVLLTFDIEVWCGGWEGLDQKFPGAFRRYIHGPSRAGNYALPKTLEIMDAHGIHGVFFVEPLFAARFGVEPLAEIVTLLKDAGQEIQLHLHPEWQNEASTPLIENHRAKRQYLTQYDLEEQTALIAHGIRLLQEAGAERPIAFRSGNYSCNRATYLALERNGILLDSSMNALVEASGVGMSNEERRTGAHYIGRVLTLPLFGFSAANGSPRYLQVGSCGFQEMKQVLESAHSSGWRYVPIVSHNFEMLVPGSSRPDWTVVRRFSALCRYLSRNRERYAWGGFHAATFTEEPSGLQRPMTTTGANMVRHAEQGYRRIVEKIARVAA